MPETMPVESHLVALEDAWARALVSNDSEEIGRFMAPDWVIVSETGVTDREGFLEFVRSGALTHSAFQVGGDARVRAYGDTAVLTKRATNTAHYGGQQFDADEWVTDVWVRRDGEWCCVLSHITAAEAAG